MRFTAILLLTLAAAPSVHSWMCGPTVLHSSLGDFDQDELFGPAIRLRAVPRQANPREAEKTFRQLDRFVDRVAGAFLDEDMAAREGKECLVKSKNCTASPIPSSKGLEIRLRPSFE